MLKQINYFSDRSTYHTLKPFKLVKVIRLYHYLHLLKRFSIAIIPFSNHSQTIRKLNPKNSPRMPPQSATSESSGNASSSFRTRIFLVANNGHSSDTLFLTCVSGSPDCWKYILEVDTSFPYFGVKLSCVCLMIAYKKIAYSYPKVTYSYPKVA